MQLYRDASGLPLGQMIPVPPALSLFLCPWSNAQYFEIQNNHVLIQEFVTDQFSVYSWRFWINDRIALYPIAQKPTIALQFMIQGNVSCELAGYGEKKLQEGFAELFYVPPHSNQVDFVPGVYNSLHIELSPSYLVDLAKTDAPVRLLLSRMDQASKEASFLTPVYLNYICHHHLKQLQHNVPLDGLLHLHLQRHIYALLIEYLSQLPVLETNSDIRPFAHAARIQRLKEFIVKEPNVNNQTIMHLARWSGLSTTTLKLAFKTSTGMSLSAFVRFHALSKAHFLLLTTPLPIEEIVFEIGYSSLSSFKRAFVQQFGYTPETIRKTK